MQKEIEQILHKDTNSKGLVKMAGTKRKYKKYTLPLLPLRGLTVFPYMILTFDVGRDKSIKALDDAMINNQLIFLVAQKDAKNDLPVQRRYI